MTLRPPRSQVSLEAVDILAPDQQSWRFDNRIQRVPTLWNRIVTMNIVGHGFFGRYSMFSSETKAPELSHYLQNRDGEFHPTDLNL